MNMANIRNAHFVLVPFMAQGHMIPMVDLAKLLARRGVFVSLVTTPFNANRIRSAINRARDAGLTIRLVELPFPCNALGLPDGCENLDVVPSASLILNFFNGLRVLAGPLQSYLEAHELYPTCMIVDILHPWTMEVAKNLRIPRLSFFSICCFTLLCMENISNCGVYESIAGENEPFLVPGLMEKIVVTKAQCFSLYFQHVPNWFMSPEFGEYGHEVKKGERMADGVVVNTFRDLEPAHIESYEKVMGKKVWSVGPFSLCNEDPTDMTARGNEISIDSRKCLSWLDRMRPGSVVYVSFGSLTSTDSSQLTEIGLGLEASNHPFVWVIKESEKSREVDRWLEGFEERIGWRGLVIKGWAPQVMILLHPAVGGFVTHCGWNSTLEGIVAGVPMVTWPHFGDQFLNERFVVDVLRIGVSVGVKEPTLWFKDGDEEGKSDKVTGKNDVAKAVECLMDDGEEAGERRERTRKLGEKARDAMREEGCSYANMTELIQSFSVT